MTALDELALNKILADGIRLACQWDMEEKEDTEWVIMESNLTPPAILTQMNDVAAWIRAAKGEINPLITTLFEEDDKLHAHIITTCNKWKLQIPQLMVVKDDELHKTMGEAYRATMINHDSKNELEMPCSKTELGIHLKGTALDRTGVHQVHAGPLLRLRSILRHAHRVESDVCPYCTGQETHTVLHVISRCSFPPTKKKRREEIERALTPTIGSYLTNMSTPQLAGVMGGPLPNDLALR
jgi:hypothetical protein